LIWKPFLILCTRPHTSIQYSFLFQWLNFYICTLLWLKVWPPIANTCKWPFLFPSVYIVKLEVRRIKNCTQSYEMAHSTKSGLPPQIKIHQFYASIRKNSPTCAEIANLYVCSGIHSYAKYSKSMLCTKIYRIHNDSHTLYHLKKTQERVSNTIWIVRLQRRHDRYVFAISCCGLLLSKDEEFCLLPSSLLQFSLPSYSKDDRLSLC